MAVTPRSRGGVGPPLTPRLFAALVAGKLAGHASRVAGRGGGTSLPGMVAMRIDAHVLSELVGHAGNRFVAISGSNGKTTTARFASALLRGEAIRVLANSAGANLVQGVTSIVVSSADLRGRLPGAVLMAEVDEAALPLVAAEVGIGTLLVTDLFRDQLDRYGELHAVAGAIDAVASSLPPASTLVLNGDDPLVARLGAARLGRRVIFGFQLEGSTDRIGRAADTIRCPACRSDLHYRAVYLSHMGDYLCPTCGFGRPPLDVAVTSLEVRGLTETRLTVRTPDGVLHLAIPQAGVHVAYDAVAAIAIAVGLGVAIPHAEASLAAVGPAFGRLEAVQAADRQVILAFAKNPTSFNTTLRTLAAVGQPRHLVFALSNTLVDGEDFAWLWDVDLEGVASTIERAVVSGTRADEVANRLKYAGVDPERIETVVDRPAALDRGLAMTPAGEPLTIVAGYTPTIEIREEMRRRGWVGRFWEP